MTPVPHHRWDVDAHYDPAGSNYKMYTRFGQWLPDVHAFDHASFRLSHVEALTMDPQSRLLLQHAAQLGLTSHDRSGAVYVGCMYTGVWRNMCS